MCIYWINCLNLNFTYKLNVKFMWNKICWITLFNLKIKLNYYTLSNPLIVAWIIPWASYDELHDLGQITLSPWATVSLFNKVRVGLHPAASLQKVWHGQRGEKRTPSQVRNPTNTPLAGDQGHYIKGDAMLIVRTLDSMWWEWDLPPWPPSPSPVQSWENIT